MESTPSDLRISIQSNLSDQICQHLPTLQKIGESQQSEDVCLELFSMSIDLRDLRHGLGLRPLTSSYFSWNSCSQRWRCDSIESINQRQLIATRARVESYTLTRCYHHLLGANDVPRSSAILFYPARAPNRGLRHFPAVGFSNDETSHCLKSHDWLHATSAAAQAPGLSRQGLNWLSDCLERVSSAHINK